MFTSIMAALAAITEGFKAFQLFVKKFDEFASFYKRVKTNEWISDLHVEIEALKKADTPEEKQHAAKVLQNKIATL